MKISYNWLKDYVKTDLTPDELSAILTSIGLEVEGLERIESVRGGLEGVVVGDVLTCGRHPDADRLSVTTVSVGGAAEPLQIVCGAPNVAAGQKVLVATVGATLYPHGEEEGFKIKKSKIRGVESLGMICAEDELGLGTDHDGIMVLDASAVAGTPAAAYLDLEGDWMIEIGLTPNRVDAASHYGVARDLAAWLQVNGRGGAATLPSVDGFAVENRDKTIKIRVEDPDGAPRYAGVTISNLRVGASPEWLQQRLRTIGLKPINNVVDITNYVLHEVGQPLHAFDLAQIEGGEVVVRTTPEGTKFTTLDEVERTLAGEDLMICNAVKPMCIGGVFGGLDSGVTEATTAVFLESAYFNPRRIRKSARRHGLNTDASFRFERGIDPNITIWALKRAAMLMKELAGGVISSEVVDLYPEKMEPFRFGLSFERLNRLIGKEIPETTVRKILAALEINVEREQDGVLWVAVPAYRVDVTREADLVEDILRIYGYNNVEIPEHVNSALTYAPKPDRDRLVNMVSDFLTANGFHEIMSNSLTKTAYYDGLEAYKAENCVKILNPLSSDLGVMRQTLLFGTLEAMQLNANRRHGDLKLYEFGNVYHYDAAKKEDSGLAPYRETWRLSLAMTGQDQAASWNVKSQTTNFFHLRAAAEKLLRRFGIDAYTLKTETLTSDLFSEGLTFSLGGRELMQMGSVAKKWRERFDLKSGVYFLEMNFSILAQIAKNQRIEVAELSKFPEVKRDLALLVDKDVTYSQLRKIAFGTEKKLLKNMSLFDVYEGDKLPEGKKSYALSFVLEDTTQTLTDAIIDRVMGNFITQFEKQTGAVIRA